MQIGTVAEAEGTRQEICGPSGMIVVQGVEASGHGREDDGMGPISLLPEAADILAHNVP
jgi:nitronate monooxygenase